MKSTPRSRMSLIAAATLAVLTALGPARAAETPPRVLIDVPFAPTDKPMAVFVPDGAAAYIAATKGARLTVLEDHTFTITGGALPAVVGRWTGYRSGTAGFMIGLWAKTEQIDLNGTLYTATGSDLFINYMVQVNAPRTDGVALPQQGSLAPASIWFMHALPLSTQGP
jgi:hypothetical protein